MENLQLLELAGVILGPGGAVYIGMRTALNGMRHDITEIKRDVHDVRDWQLKDKGN